MTLSIAVLEPSEVAAFRALLSLFGTVFAEDGETPAPLPDDAYLAALLADPTFAAVVARTEQGTIAGGLTLRFWRSYTKAGNDCYLYDLAVGERYRRQGVASRLVQHAIEVARQRDAVAMWVQAEADDEDAVAFYRTLPNQELAVAHFELL